MSPITPPGALSFSVHFAPAHQAAVVSRLSAPLPAGNDVAFGGVHRLQYSTRLRPIVPV